MKIAAWLLFFLGFSAGALAECRDRSVRIVEERLDDGRVRLCAQSDNLLDFTITLESLRLENMEASRPLPVTADAKGQKTIELVVLRIKDTQHAWHYEPLFSWRYGARGGGQGRVAYRLPYSPGEEHRLIQGYFGEFSHNAGSQNEYAYDWAMPVGTTVCAAREGVVVGVRQDSDLGGPDKAFTNCGNYVIIRHDDGTYAEYFHLKKDGALVAPGAFVQAGQPIALSGATGFASVPHLHFAVFRPLDGYKRETLPAFFRTSTGLHSRLIEGQDY
ncbi:MAG TPA: M23 family metallopeptidase [Opitutaceae bacterium]|nr:M23 family metallopeptidase [Opitutaceae bacterium]